MPFHKTFRCLEIWQICLRISDMLTFTMSTIVLSFMTHGEELSYVCIRTWFAIQIRKYAYMCTVHEFIFFNYPQVCLIKCRSEGEWWLWCLPKLHLISIPLDILCFNSVKWSDSKTNWQFQFYFLCKMLTGWFLLLFQNTFRQFSARTYQFLYLLPCYVVKY